MLLKHLYIMSLEYPGPGCAIWFGGEKLDELRCYVKGYLNCLRLLNLPTDEDDAFFDWLKEIGYFPPNGWSRTIVTRTGDGEAAYLEFFKLLNKYLFEKKPSWLIEFNQKPQPSPLVNALGEHRSKDIRKVEHIEGMKSMQLIKSWDANLSDDILFSVNIEVEEHRYSNAFKTRNFHTRLVSRKITFVYFPVKPVSD